MSAERSSAACVGFSSPKANIFVELRNRFAKHTTLARGVTLVLTLSKSRQHVVAIVKGLLVVLKRVNHSLTTVKGSNFVTDLGSL